MKRIFLFILTNIAVMLVISLVLSILGVNTTQAVTGQSISSLLVMSLVVGFTGSFISLAMSKWMAKRSVGARVIEQPANATEQWLVETVRRQAMQANIGMPEVAIFDAAEPNAFATGARKNAALVAVSTGLLNSMTREEAEAVMAHEISHVANGDMVTLTLIQGVVNTFVFFFSRIVGNIVDKVIFKTEEGEVGPAYYITSIIAELLFGFLAMIVVMWFSRQREFRADAGGAHIAGRQAMINALKRLQNAHGADSMPQNMAALGISDQRKSFSRLFMSHPPLEERIERLQQAV